MLSNKNIKALVGFARGHLDVWENTLWADETKVGAIVFSIQSDVGCNPQPNNNDLNLQTGYVYLCVSWLIIKISKIFISSISS